MDVHSLDAASTTVDCRIHFFDKNLVKKWTLGHPHKVGAASTIPEKVDAAITFSIRTSTTSTQWDAAPTPGLTDVCLPSRLLLATRAGGQDVAPHRLF